MSRRLRLPKNAAALGEALAVELEHAGRMGAVSLRGRILGTDAGARRLFAVKPARLDVSEPPRGRRGASAGAVRRSWQGADVARWLRVQTPAPGRAEYVGRARRIYYRSTKHGGGLATYVHDFGRPAPAAYRAGPNWFFVGGKKRITHRGIVD